MTKETKEYLINILEANVMKQKGIIAEKQRWLDHHRKNKAWFERNHDMSLAEYEAWANKVISNHEAVIAKAEKAVHELTEED